MSEKCDFINLIFLGLMVVIFVFSVNARGYTLNICGIGDSITAGYLSSPSTDPITLMVNDLNTLAGSTRYAAVNSAVSGSHSYDWVGGTPNLAIALNNFAPLGCDYILYMIGTNDCATTVATSPSQWKVNVQNTIAALENAGYQKIILNFQPYVVGGGAWDAVQSNDLLNQYQAQYATIAAADPHVFVGDTTAWSYFKANTNLLQDGVHPSGPPVNAGYSALSQLWATAFESLFWSAGPARPLGLKIR